MQREGITAHSEQPAPTVQKQIESKHPADWNWISCDNDHKCQLAHAQEIGAAPEYLVAMVVKNKPLLLFSMRSLKCWVHLLATKVNNSAVCEGHSIMKIPKWQNSCACRNRNYAHVATKLSRQHVTVQNRKACMSKEVGHHCSYMDT